MSSLPEESEDRAYGTNTPIYFWNKVHTGALNSASWRKKRERSRAEDTPLLSSSGRVLIVHL